MTVGELLSRCSSVELTYWQALWKLRAAEAEKQRNRQKAKSSGRGRRR
jgi:hypothetical protein